MSSAAAPRPVVLFTNSMVMGGMEEHVLQLGRGFASRGHKVAVICSPYPEIQPLRDQLGRQPGLPRGQPGERHLPGDRRQA